MELVDMFVALCCIGVVIVTVFAIFTVASISELVYLHEKGEEDDRW